MNSPDSPALDDGFNAYVNPYLGELLAALRLDVRYVHGNGSWLTDDRGRRYLDFVCGYGAVPFGHSPRCAAEASQRYFSARGPAVVQPSRLDAAGRLARRLCELAPPGLKYAWFTNSGAESVEAALKACRAATGKPGVVYAAGSFHGKTLGALSATGSPKYQSPFHVPLPHFHGVPFGDATALEAVLQSASESIACVILEPIQGEGGIVVAPAGYLAKVRELCDRYGVLMVLDEIQTGLGRTGALFACQQEDVTPDGMTLSKALGAGVIPIGCVLLGERAYSRDFALLHSSTYAGNALACEIALASLEMLTDAAADVAGNVARRGAQLMEGLHALHRRYPAVVHGVRGRGLMLGLEIGYRDAAPAGRGSILQMASQQGHLLALVSAYLLNVEGIRTAPTLSAGHVLRIEPALTVTEEECARFLAALDRLLAVLAAGDSAAMLRPLLQDEQGGRPKAELALQVVPVKPGVAEPREGDARIAFLVHSVEPRFSAALDPSLASLGGPGVKQAVNLIANVSEPFVLSRIRVEAGGAAAYVEFVCIPHYAEALLAMPEGEASALVGRAIRLAADRGAQLVGLGGFTSIVTAGGTRAMQHGVAVTTGNTFTVVTALEAVREALTLRGLALADAHMMIVGATGMIGGTLISNHLGRVRRLTLAGNPAKPTTTRRRLVQHLEAALATAPHEWLSALPSECTTEQQRTALAESMVAGEADLDVDCPADTRAQLAEADIIVCATNSPDFLIDVAALKPGAIILDLSRPHNIDPVAARSRPDVLFIEGGLVSFPGAPDLGLDVGAPPGQGLACMAETVMLGLARHFEHTSVGARIDQPTQDMLRGLARRFGFGLGSLRSFNRTLSATDVQRTFAGEQEAPMQVHVAAPPLHVVGSSHPGNLAAALLHSHRRLTGVPALIESESGATIGYPALWQRVACAARRLRAAQIQQGDVVALCAVDSIAAITGLLACWWVGAVAAPLNPGAAETDRQNMVAVLQPKAVLIDARHAHLGQGKAFASCMQLSLEEVTADQPQWHAELAGEHPLELQAGATAVYLFSSGSSGRPKAFAHTHGDCLTVNVNYIPSVVGLQPGERVFSPSRMYFAYGLLAITFALFAGGTSILAPQPAKNLDFAQLMVRHQPNVVFAVPTILKFLCAQWQPQHACDSLRLMVSAGEALSASLYREVGCRLGVEVLDGIGCTEVLSTYISNRRGESRAEATGQVVPGFEVRLLNEAGAACAPGEPGVLWVRGDTLATGVHGDPALTAKVFRGGWFNTNDLFQMDANQTFQYLGRANDVLKINGCWVAPTLIEDVLLGHPAIEECAVVPALDEHGLLRPKAVVVFKDSRAEALAVWRELQDRCKQHLGAHQYPHLFESRVSLPRTASGKLQRALLR